MNIYLAISIGLFKIFALFFVLFYLVRRYLVLRRDFVYIFDIVIRKYFEYQNILIISLFVTINLKIYDGIIVGFVMLFFGLWDYFGVVYPWQVPKAMVKLFKKIILTIIKHIEKEEFSFSKFFKYDNSKLGKKNVYILNSLLFLILSVIFISYYFIRYDHYLFSNNWFDVLEMVNAKDQGNWFTRDIAPEGIYALINFLSHLTNSSPEITIYIFSIYQILIVVIIIFWFIQKMTNSQIVIPVLVCVFYILGFTYLPSNITNFYQSSSIHLAFTILLPLMFYVFRLKLLPYTDTKKRIIFLTAFLAIALLDLYVFLFLLPITLLLTAIIYFNKKSKFRFELLFIYFSSVGIIYLVYNFFLNKFSQTYEDLLRKTLISVESYFYNPFISVEVDKLIFYYQFTFIVVLVLNIIFALVFKGKWKKNVIFLFFISVIYILTQVDNKWVDKDILLRVLTILIPVQTGLSFSVVFEILKKIFKKEVYYSYRGNIIIVLAIVTFFVLQKPVLLLDKEEEEILNEDVLSVNELILRNYLDRTYMVVNRSEFVNLSSGQHYFMGYDEFLSNKYAKQDSIYAKYLNNNKFLLKNPQLILPSSVFVFLYDKKYIGEEDYEKILEKLNELKNKGRNQRQIFKTKQLTVYEVINKPKSSKINELVF